MERTYSLNEVASILCLGGDQIDHDQMYRRVRHWTNLNLLETVGEKYVGTGKARSYNANQIRLAAWYAEMANYGENGSAIIPH